VAGLLRLPPGEQKYRGLVGTGGIGHGSFFLLEGNQTLGREESRLGGFLDRNDYCKLHIICHYVKLLLGERMQVVPIGRVGDDDSGRRLAAEMEAVGLDLRHVRAADGLPTLFSFCFLYPDGSGGNLTTGNSASGAVDAAAIGEAEPSLRAFGRSGIALAVPEVPLGVRRMLLEHAARFGLLRVASFSRAEMDEVRGSGLLGQVDLLAVNLEEAAAAAGKSAASTRSEPALIARNAAEALTRDFPHLRLSITAGKAGSWSWQEGALTFDESVPVEVAGTSGAGDAHCAGILAGMAAGHSLAEAQQLGTIVAAASVTSPHTIHPAMTLDLLRTVCARRVRTSARVLALLDMAIGGS
jgi:ribokinase